MKVTDTVRGFASLVGGEVVNKLARFIASVVLARNLTVADFGIFNIGIAVAGIGVMGCSLGLPDVAARDIAVEPDRLRPLAWTVLTVRIGLLGLLGIGGVLATTLFGGDPSTAALIAALAVLLGASGEWALRGLGRLPAFARAMSSGGIVVLAGALALVPRESTAQAGLAVLAIGELCTTLMTWRSAGIGWPRPTLGGLRALLRRSWPVGLSALAVYAYYANLDTVLLGATRSAREAGLYSAPYRLFLGVNIIAVFAAYALFRPYAELFARGDGPRAVDLLRRAFLPLAAYGLIILASAEIAGESILVGLFGPDFGQMRSVLVVLCLTMPWYCVGYPCGYLLIARDENRRFMAGAAVAGVGNVVLNLILIPPYGPAGAAAATAIALVAGSVIWIAAHRLLDRRVAAMLLVLAACSLGAIIAARRGGSADTIGVVTLVVGLLVAAGAAPDLRRVIADLR
jgi:O-antigen/teichoic acid export membrane protein